MPPDVVSVRNCGARTEHEQPVGGVRWHSARLSWIGIHPLSGSSDKRSELAYNGLMESTQNEQSSVWNEAEHKQIMLGYAVFIVIYVVISRLVVWVIEIFPSPGLVGLIVLGGILLIGIFLLLGALGELNRKEMHRQLKRRAALRDLEDLYRARPESMNRVGDVSLSTVVQAGRICGDINFKSSDDSWW